MSRLPPSPRGEMLRHDAPVAFDVVQHPDRLAGPRDALAPIDLQSSLQSFDQSCAPFEMMEHRRFAAEFSCGALYEVMPRAQHATPTAERYFAKALHETGGHIAFERILLPESRLHPRFCEVPVFSDAVPESAHDVIG